MVQMQYSAGGEAIGDIVARIAQRSADAAAQERIGVGLTDYAAEYLGTIVYVDISGCVSETFSHKGV